VPISGDTPEESNTSPHGFREDNRGKALAPLSWFVFELGNQEIRAVVEAIMARPHELAEHRTLSIEAMAEGL